MTHLSRRGFLSRSAAACAVATLAGASGRASVAKKYRVCIIGDTRHGGYGHDLHLVWGLRDDVEVAALADPDEAGRAKHAAEAGAVRTYADYREMLEKERPDVVAIGPRWSVRHLEYLIACAEAGAHGILEKPLTTDLAQGDTAIAALTARNLKWAIAFNFRAAPQVAHARRLLLEDRLIGDLLEVRARGKEDHRAGGEDLVVLGIHLFDMMIHFLGQPRWCFADVAVDGRPAGITDTRDASEAIGPVAGDSIHAVFGFENGIPGYFASRKGAANGARRYGMDIYGTQGVLAVRMDSVRQIAWLPNPGWVSRRDDSSWQLLPGMPEISLRTPEKVSHYAPIIDDLIDAIEGDRAPAVSVRDGLAATEMIQAVFESMVQGGRMTLPLQERAHPLTRPAR